MQILSNALRNLRVSVHADDFKTRARFSAKYLTYHIMGTKIIVLCALQASKIEK